MDRSSRNGLHKPSQLMVDKLFTVLTDRDRALQGWLGLAGVALMNAPD